MTLPHETDELILARGGTTLLPGEALRLSMRYDALAAELEAAQEEVCTLRRASSPYGTFSGLVSATWLVEGGEDWRMQLLAPVSYTTPDGAETVTVPTGAIVNGASIPAIAWPFIGGPYNGDFRRASVVHDYECQEQVTASEVVHRRFYDMIRADGVGTFRAWLMYQCVKRWGPQFPGAAEGGHPHTGLAREI